MKHFLVELAHFWSAWLRNPKTIGAIAPSSAGLGRAMLKALGEIASDGKVLELGPGTGPVTAQLVKQLSPQQIIALERDSSLVSQL